ncbi:MAG TPA: hypothetical protein VMZ04_03800 [Anaerolineae bacterium]|nr:hypothetical protein [Anaerolineae bacterium]
MFNLPVRDTQTGLKVFRREVLRDVFPRLLVKKYAYDVELLATAVRLGYKVYEIPVVLDFKRDLVWGRIRMEDIMSILIDTLAIFYRLKLMKYYDAKRPPVLKDEKAVLVVVSGYPPPDDVIKRLSIDSNTRIACISETDAGLQNDVMYFPSIERFDSWISLCADDFEIIGFLGSGYLPLGSWVKNAVRNFENPSVSAVCGPIIPGPLSNRLEKTAGLLVSSFITTGPDNYLYSVKPIKTVRKCLLENVFLRAELFEKKQLKEHGISIVNNYVYDISSTENLILYDPDVAVSKPVSPLFTPYLGLVARDAFSKGFGFSLSGHIDNRWWMIFPTVLWFVFMIGWVFLPLYLYTVFIMLYLFIIIITGLSCFDFLTAPLFMSGILLEHFIRAIAFPAGLCAGLLKAHTMR